MFRNGMRLAALAGACCAVFAAAGCIVIEDREGVHAGDELHEGVHEAAHEVAEVIHAEIAGVAGGVAHALEGLAEGVSAEVFQELSEISGESLVEAPIPFRELYDVLPEEAGGFERASREGATVGAFGWRASTAEADYERRDGATIEVEIIDIGALPVGGLPDMLAEMDVEEETSRGWSRTLDYDDYPAFAEFRGSEGQRGRAEFLWLVEGRFVVSLEGRGVTLDELYEVRDAIDSRALARMRDREG